MQAVFTIATFKVGPGNPGRQVNVKVIEEFDGTPSGFGCASHRALLSVSSKEELNADSAFPRISSFVFPDGSPDWVSISDSSSKQAATLRLLDSNFGDSK